MQATTIKIHADTKDQLNKFREHNRESYDEVIKKIVFIVTSMKDDPEMSKQTIHAIEKSRERIRKGKFLSEEAAKKRLGL